MGNHYHLLLQTPRANLSRIMRHINGVYTQRYNRLRKSDGPLFRGRFKAIVVDADAYLLQLSRYIHRNPIELKTPLVKRLELYQWSSYSSYVGKANKGVALKKDLIYEKKRGQVSCITYRKPLLLPNATHRTTRIPGRVLSCYESRERAPDDIPRSEVL